MRRTLTDGDFSGEFQDQLAGFGRSAWRWENQPVYEIGPEADNVAAYLAGRPQDPMTNRYLGPWMLQVAQQTAAGKRVGRVRVLEEPPTPYQQWELWLDRWNTEAGEQILYLPRSAVRTDLAGRAPFDGTDWWLFDEQRVMIMHFDRHGKRIKVELTDEPGDVADAITFSRQAQALAQQLASTAGRVAA